MITPSANSKLPFFVGLLCLLLQIGCQKTQEENTPKATRLPHSSSSDSAEDILLRASGACLARISKLEELDERPSDGDHFVKAWLEPIEASGIVPEFLYLVVEYGGMRPVEDMEELSQREMVLRHDSLKVGELHWFIFSDDYDSAKYPAKVAAWWRYKEGTVPQDVIAAIENDRFKGMPHWDETLDVVYSASQEQKGIQVLIREGGSIAPEAVIFEKLVPGEFRSLSINHHNGTYEMDWTEFGEINVATLATVDSLGFHNPFHLPPGPYRMMYVYDLTTGALLAQWVAKDQEVWLMQAFQQYDMETGEVVIDMSFQLMKTGGIEVGGETDNWYRRIVRKYESGMLVSTKVYRHEHIKTGKEAIFSGSGWLLIDQDTQED